jgi:hypothetical protein
MVAGTAMVVGAGGGTAGGMDVSGGSSRRLLRGRAVQLGRACVGEGDRAFVGTCTQAPGEQTLLTFPFPLPCSKEEEEP